MKRSIEELARIIEVTDCVIINDGIAKWRYNDTEIDKKINNSETVSNKEVFNTLDFHLTDKENCLIYVINEEQEYFACNKKNEERYNEIIENLNIFNDDENIIVYTV